MKPIITIFALIIIAALAVIIIAKFANNKNSAPQGGNTVIDIPEVQPVRQGKSMTGDGESTQPTEVKQNNN